MLVSSAGPNGQKTKAQFTRNFDISQHKPGTVFRIEYANAKRDKTYAWYAIGDPSKTNPKVYWPYEGLSFRSDDERFLRLNPNFEVKDCQATETYFEVPEAGRVLHHFELRDENHYPVQVSGVTVTADDVFRPTRIELIQSGYTVKEKVKERTPAGVAVLKPAFKIAT